MRQTLKDWRRPIDAEFAFQLRPADAIPLPELYPGRQVGVDGVAAAVLEPADADRFNRLVLRWSGPEDEVGPDAHQPYRAAQTTFVERTWRARWERADLEACLAGQVGVYRHPEGQVDYLLRDHHTLDVLLYHYWSNRELPRGLFHVDRHSDWCTDAYLASRRPAQAATWWALVEGLKTAEGRPVLTERGVVFTTAQPGPEANLTGRDVGAATRVPWWVDPTDLPWPAAIARPELLDADWVSLDLDYFQPVEQFRLTRGLLRAPPFTRLLREARVRLFVLSPQFTAGGDRVAWRVQGSRSTSLRLLRLLREV